MTQRTVRRCGEVIRWEYRCPRTWDALTATEDPTVRHCGQCSREVHFCADDASTIEHARAGHCIAREEPSAGELPAAVLGMVDVRHTPSEQVALDQHIRERGITDALRVIDTATRTCPRCSYPIPSFRDRCYVCAHVIAG